MSQILENVSLAGKTSDLNLRETPKMHHPQKREFPITGGWGYSIEDGIVIDKNDPIVEMPRFFNGVAIEYEVAKLRLYEELYYQREPNNRYANIKHELKKQLLLSNDGRMFDHLVFFGSCHKEQDWIELERQSKEKLQLDKTYYRDHQLRVYDMQWDFMAQYYFDISSFY